MQPEKVSLIQGHDGTGVRPGRIDEIQGNKYRILAGARHYLAQRAFSCLVEPQKDDLVLFSSDGHSGHVLAILERSGEQSAYLRFPADVALHAEQGQISLHGDRLNLSSKKQLSLLGDDFSLNALRGVVNIERLSAIGSFWTGKITNLQAFAHTLETVAEHWIQKLKNSFRQIDGVDQVKSRDALHIVDNLYSMRSTQAAILARKDIKVDAERIHMG